jgi:hypothetical protein
MCPALLWGKISLEGEGEDFLNFVGNLVANFVAVLSDKVSD